MSKRLVILGVVFVGLLAAWLVTNRPEKVSPQHLGDQTPAAMRRPPAVTTADAALPIYRTLWEKLQAFADQPQRWKITEELPIGDIKPFAGEPWFGLRQVEGVSLPPDERLRLFELLINEDIRLVPSGLDVLAIEPAGAIWIRRGIAGDAARFDGQSWSDPIRLPAPTSQPVDRSPTLQANREARRLNVRDVWIDRDGNAFLIGFDREQRNAGLVIRRATSGELSIHYIPETRGEGRMPDSAPRAWQQPDGRVVICSRNWDDSGPSDDRGRWRAITYLDGKWDVKTLRGGNVSHSPYLVLPNGSLIFATGPSQLLRVPPIEVDEQPMLRQAALRMDNPDFNVREQAMWDLTFLMTVNRDQTLAWLLEELGYIPEIRSRLERIRDAVENEDTEVVEGMRRLVGRIETTPIRLMQLASDGVAYFWADAARDATSQVVHRPAVVTLSPDGRWDIKTSSAVSQRDTFRSTARIEPFIAPDGSIWPEFGYQILPGGVDAVSLLSPGSGMKSESVKAVDREGRIWTQYGAQSVEIIDPRYDPPKPLLPYEVYQLDTDLWSGGAWTGFERVGEQDYRIVKLGVDASGRTELPKVPTSARVETLELPTHRGVLANAGGELWFYDGETWHREQNRSSLIERHAAHLVTDLRSAYVFTTRPWSPEMIVPDRQGGFWHYHGRLIDSDWRLRPSNIDLEYAREVFGWTRLRYFDGKIWHTADLPLEPEDTAVHAHRIYGRSTWMLIAIARGDERKERPADRLFAVGFVRGEGIKFTRLTPEQATALIDDRPVILEPDQVLSPPRPTSFDFRINRSEQSIQLVVDHRVLHKQKLDPTMHNARILYDRNGRFWLTTLEGVRPITISNGTAGIQVQFGDLAKWGYPMLAGGDSVDDHGWMWRRESGRRYARLKLPEAQPLGDIIRSLPLPAPDR